MDRTLSTANSAAAQAAYAELFEVARQLEINRSVENLSGSFNRKTVKGSTYWYYQYAQGGSTRQIFVGRDDENLRALVERSRMRDTSQVGRLAKAAITLGCTGVTPVHFRVIRRLNETGFFRAGGILIGAHAFATYGNALGVSWGEIAKTQDLDFAHAGRNIELALPTDVNLGARSAIESLEEGFLPLPGFRPWDPTGSFVSKNDKHLRLDFLTPLRGGHAEVFEHPDLGLHLQPVRFLEFLLEDIDQAAVLGNAGAVIVNVPDPARFALHKLLVFAERRERNPAKAMKDLRHAAALLEVLADYRGDTVLALWKDLLSRGPGWRKRAGTAIAALEKLAPQLDLLEPLREALAPKRPAPRK